MPSDCREASALVRAGGGAPAPVEKSWLQGKHMTKKHAGQALVFSGAFYLFAFPARPAYPAPLALPALEAAQVSFDQAIRDLGSPDASLRLRTAQMLKDAAYPEAAVPLGRLMVDPRDDIQIEAIAAELNIFLAEKIVARRRVGFVIEVRTPLAAEASFTAGPLAIGPRPVPLEVLDGLRKAARDDNPRVRLEAVYAFGVLAVESGGARRRDLLRTSGPDLAAMIGAVDPAQRYAALRVIGRVFERRPQDDPIALEMGDAVISALNEKDDAMRAAAMQALGAMRYERAVQGLTDLFQYYGKGDMARAALDAIAHIAHPSCVPLLASQLTSKDLAFKGIAIEGLARAGDRTKLADIQSASSGQRNDNLLLTGSFASVMLSGAPADLLGPIVEALARPKLRDQARGYLVDAALGHTQAFARHLRNPDARLRADLIDALGLRGDSAAVALVEPLAADPDVQVAHAVERALARLRQTQRSAT